MGELWDDKDEREERFNEYWAAQVAEEERQEREAANRARVIVPDAEDARRDRVFGGWVGDGHTFTYEGGSTVYA